MIYDVSVRLDDRTPIFPGDPTFKRNLSASMAEGDACNVSHLDFGAHTGTHVDAPLHMIPGATDVSRLSADRLVGPVRVVEISDPAEISPEELRRQDWRGVERVLFKTRNSTLWGKPTFDPSFVYVSEAAAQFLCHETRVGLVGIDYLSVEKFGSKQFPVHVALMQRDIIIVEGLNLSAVPAGEYLFFCGPLLVGQGDGAPCRVFLADPDSFDAWRAR